MYSADLASISLDDFEGAIRSVDLVPSRRVLKDHIGEVVAALRAMEVCDLEAARRLLRDKRRYPELAPALGVDEGYLVLLAREINSYLTKPLALDRLESLSETELRRLAAAGLRSTRDLYDRAARRDDRDSLADASGISPERLGEVLELCDLVRVTGIGPASAAAFRDIGIHSPNDYLATDSQTIQDRYADWTEAHTGRREMLGIADIDYCRRYAAALSDDIER